MSRRNEEVATLLENIAELLAAKEGDPYRIRAYEEAARSITATAEDIEELHRAGRLQDIPRVGESIAAKVAEYLDTNRSTYYEELKR
jgi:DNA polymerase (family 10)